ncbi:GNAT family N-acetyltransferase [Nonomuraea sp. NBC_01738]|uniref:hypothetical protein n=1 Tax=Nonomuraea sp. NBC_01738 TaxID=2976003 RepID=UPI002E132A50|nr:GNAT family N-acetyltransferase [Nonomuraea sp. NBC_01738]
MHFRTGVRDDAGPIATLHTESWRSAYAAIMPPAYLNGPLLQENERLWTTRLSGEDTSAAHLLLAEAEGTIQGFTYLVAKPDGRVLLDNLHVRPARKGAGIGVLEYSWPPVRA